MFQAFPQNPYGRGIYWFPLLVGHEPDFAPFPLPIVDGYRDRQELAHSHLPTKRAEVWLSML